MSRRLGGGEERSEGAGSAGAEAGHVIFRLEELEWDAPSGGDTSRGIVRLSEQLVNMRANVWRHPPGTAGRRHLERVQEEMFIVLEGTATLLLGDPAERVDLPQGSIAAVQPGTPLQVRNDSDAEMVVLIVGAPPETGQAEYLEDAY